MFTVAVSAFARVPLQTAIAYVADFRNAPQWQHGLTGVEVDAPFPEAKNVVEVRQFLGRRIEAPGELTEWVPGTGFTVRGYSGPLKVESRYGFAAEDGGTRISLRLTMAATGLARLGEPLLRRSLTRELNTAFKRLATMLGADTAGSPARQAGQQADDAGGRGLPPASLRRIATAAAGFAGTAAAIRAARGQADVQGRTALVTGASRGLGFLIARELAAAGCRLALCARTAADLDRAARELRSLGATVVTMPCDVSDQAQAEGFVRMAETEIGPPDILVNNAGVIRVGPLSAMSKADFDEALAVMFWGTVHVTLAALAPMRERQRGNIVNIASIGGKLTIPHLLPYTCAKFAVAGFSEGLRTEVADDGIQVTTVLPGLLRTGSHVRATYTGDPAGEFAWFALGSSLPLASMDAERAARRIVAAMRRGRCQVALPASAITAVWLQAMFPQAMSAAMRGVNRRLPRAAGAAAADGQALREQQESGLPSWVFRLSEDAARRFNQLGGD